MTLKKTNSLILTVLNNLDLSDVVEDGDNIWFATNKGLYRYRKLSGEIIKVDGLDSKVRALAWTGEYLLLGMDFGLLAVTINSNGKVSKIDTMVHTPFINDIEVDDDKIWLAAKEGLLVHSPALNKTSKFIYEASNPYSLFEGELLSLAKGS